MELVWLGDITLFGPERYTANITKIQPLKWEIKVKSNTWTVHINRHCITKWGAQRAAKQLVNKYQTESHQHWHKQWKIETNRIRYYLPDHNLAKLQYYMVYDPLAV